jgi:biotin carboxyl carrier protein
VVEAGQTVSAGDACIVIEAMKMLHTLTSPVDGTVDEVTVAVGDQVASAQLLVTFDTGTSDGGTSDNEESTP